VFWCGLTRSGASGTGGLGGYFLIDDVLKSDTLVTMDAIKKEQAIPRPRIYLGGPQAGEDAAIWWGNWARDHSEQIDAYNKDVVENGVWSDGLRTF
jgi:hypothetical protein